MGAVAARQLRKNMTEAEKKLWRKLQLKQVFGLKFRRQCPIGRYIVDFACFEPRLIVEIDGGQHANRVADDARRSAWFEIQGFHVMRFWNHEVLTDTEAVITKISEVLTPHLRPPPQGGRKML